MRTISVRVAERVIVAEPEDVVCTPDEYVVERGEVGALRRVRRVSDDVVVGKFMVERAERRWRAWGLDAIGGATGRVWVEACERAGAEP